MALIKLIFYTILFIFLNSCSLFDKENNEQSLIDLYLTFKEKPFKSFDRQELNNIDYPLIEIRTNGVIKQNLMLQISLRNNIVNYTSGSGQTLTMQGALVTKTNGFNTNLISVKTSHKSPLIFLENIENWKNFDNRTYTFVTPGFTTENIKVDHIFLT